MFDLSPKKTLQPPEPPTWNMVQEDLLAASSTDQIFSNMHERKSANDTTADDENVATAENVLEAARSLYYTTSVVDRLAACLRQQLAEVTVARNNLQEQLDSIRHKARKTLQSQDVTEEVSLI